LTLVCLTVQNLRATSRQSESSARPAEYAGRAEGHGKGEDVESIRSLTTRGELLSLSHLLELTHAVVSQAERTAAEAERNRKADYAAVRALIELGLLKVLRPICFGGSESGFPGFVRICLAYRAGS
jgi:hypothetical protein